MKQLVFANRFGDVLISEEVGDKPLLMRLRLHIAMQNWRADLESSNEPSTYSEFKSLLNPDKYLNLVGNYFIRKQLANYLYLITIS